MSRPCRECGDPIDRDKQGGRNVPVNPGTKTDHRETCSARQGQVPDRLKRPTAHHTSASKLKKFSECQFQFFLEVVREEKIERQTDAMDSGKLEHAAVEYVTVERAKALDFARPVTPEELHAALDVVVGREAFNAESLMHAREVLAKAAHKIDLAFVARDEHGPLVERKFELPVGAGVVVGGILDLVEFVGDDLALIRDYKGGQFREPRPEKSPAVGIYAEWASLLWPEREIRVVLQYLALDVEDEVRGEELLEARALAKSLARAVVTKARVRSQDDDAWPATFGGHCARCPYTAKCPTFQARMAEPIGEHEPETLDELVDAIYRFGPVATVAAKKVQEWRKKAIELAAPALGASGRALVGGYPIRVKTITRKGYEVKTSTYQQLDVDDPSPEAVAAEQERVAKLVADYKALILGRKTVEGNLVLVKPATVGPTEHPNLVTHPDGKPLDTTVSWERAGGPNECAHGWAAGLACPKCDKTKPPEASSGSTAAAQESFPARGGDAAEPTPPAAPTAPVEAHATSPVASEAPGETATPPAVTPPGPEEADEDLERKAADEIAEQRAFERTPASTVNEEPSRSCGCPVIGPHDHAKGLGSRAEVPLNHETAVIALARQAENPGLVSKIVTEATPAHGTTLPIQDVLHRIGLGQVRHAEDLVAAPDKESCGVSSAVLNLLERAHGRDRVLDLWRSVGGEHTGGDKPRRKPLTGGQLRRLVVSLPPIFDPAYQAPAGVSAGEPSTPGF